MSIYDAIYQESLRHAKHRVWVLSDLQQALPENTRRCLASGMEDFELLGRPAEQIWYLGDAVEGADLKHLIAMSELQERAFGELGLPLCYATGNHDYDYPRRNPGQPICMPFWEMVRDHPGWHTTQRCDEMYFRIQLGSWPVYFFCDHIAPDGTWFSTHSRIPAPETGYPYDQAYFDALRAQIAAETHEVITAGHGGFSGCNRDHELRDRLFPLPSNVAMHLYGHSHIGDTMWGRENVYRRISWVDWHDIPQVDVSSFENIRGECCRSVLLHIHEDDTMALFFRNHDEHCFTEAYFPSRTRYPEQYSAKPEFDRRLEEFLRYSHH